MVPDLLVHKGEKRIQPHPSYLHHYPTNTHPFHPSPYRIPNPYRYPPYHPDPLQHTHHPTHHTCSTIQPTIPPNSLHPPSQSYLHLPRYNQPSHPTSFAPSPPAQTPPPFHRLYRQHPLPAQWEPFTLDRYTGETDPDEHLKVTSPMSPCTRPKT